MIRKYKLVTGVFHVIGHLRVKLLTTAQVVKAVVGQLTHPATVDDTVGALQAAVTAEFTLM